MKLYFLLSQHPTLHSLPLNQRALVFAAALKQIGSWQKIALNLFKLAWLVPPFILFARYESQWELIAAVVMLVVYPLVLRPFQIGLSEPFFVRVIEELGTDTGLPPSRE